MTRRKKKKRRNEKLIVLNINYANQSDLCENYVSLKLATNPEACSQVEKY